jgi:branched-chain amino acid transport system substrate-binding protein
VFPWVFPLVSNYWDAATGIVKFIGEKEGGNDKLKGKKIVLLYHDSASAKNRIRYWRQKRRTSASSSR